MVCFIFVRPGSLETALGSASAAARAAVLPLLLDAADLVGGMSVVEVAKRGDTASDVGWMRRLEISFAGA